MVTLKSYGVDLSISMYSYVYLQMAKSIFPDRGDVEIMGCRFKYIYVDLCIFSDTKVYIFKMQGLQLSSMTRYVYIYLLRYI